MEDWHGRGEIHGQPGLDREAKREWLRRKAAALRSLYEQRGGPT
jgi:hypothetical protein